MSLLTDEVVLLLIAHPDDEVVFFSPLLFHLEKHRVRSYVLTVTTGNWDADAGQHSDALGAARMAEFQRASTFFPGVTFLTHEEIHLDDNPRAYLRTDLIVRLLVRLAAELSLTAIVSFDHKGYTGHKNHVSCFRALEDFKKLNKHVSCFTLRTPGFHKYTGALTKEYYNSFPRPAHSDSHFVLQTRAHERDHAKAILASAYKSQATRRRRLMMSVIASQFINEYDELFDRHNQQ